MISEHSINPSSLTPETRKMLGTPINLLSKSLMRHKFTKISMAHNYENLKQHACEFDLLVQDHPNSYLSYGNACCPVSNLENLLHEHRNW